MAGRWVAGLVAAAVSVRGLATALVVLRGALIRTGIGALIVAAGEMVYQFGAARHRRRRLRRGAVAPRRRGVGGLGADQERRAVAGPVAAIGLGADRGRLADGARVHPAQLGRLPARGDRRPRAVSPAWRSDLLAVSEAAIRAGSAFYETAAAAGEASARADDLAASAAAAADAATAPLAVAAGAARRRRGCGRGRGRPRPPAASAPAAAGGTGGPLGGVDKALGTATQAAGGAAKAIGEVRTEAEDLAQTLQQNVAQNLGSLFAGLITGATIAEGVDRLGHRPARRAGADPRLRDAARRRRASAPDRSARSPASCSGPRRGRPAGRSLRAGPTSSASEALS